MNLYNLKYFIDSAKNKSMTKAAELNNLSRPAISQGIQKLEIELGTKLLVHKRRSFELTTEGMLLLKKAEPLLNQMDELREEIKDPNSPTFGELTIGSSRTLATFNLSQVIKKLKSKHVNVDFKIVLANSESLIKKISNKEVDLLYFIGDENLHDHKQIVVSKGHFVLVEPKDRKGEWSFAITEKRPETERIKTLYERNFSKPLPVFAEIQSWDAIWNWVNLGICGGLVPDFLLKNTSQNNVKVVLPKVFPYEIKILIPKQKQKSKLIEDLIDSLK